MNVEAKWYLST